MPMSWMESLRWTLQARQNFFPGQLAASTRHTCKKSFDARCFARRRVSAGRALQNSKNYWKEHRRHIERVKRKVVCSSSKEMKLKDVKHLGPRRSIPREQIIRFRKGRDGGFSRKHRKFYANQFHSNILSDASDGSFEIF